MDYSGLNEVLNSSNSNGDVAAALAVLGVFFVFILIFALIAIIFKIIARWIFFKKCGEEGWKAIIPFYTDFTLVSISGLNWWWFLILISGTILSSVNSSFNVLTNNNSTSGLVAVAAVVSILSFFASLAAIFARINQSYNIAKKFSKNGTAFD